MTLKEYLTKHKITFRAFSVKVDIDAAQLNRYANGQYKPSLENAYKIYKATRTRVTFLSWFE